MKTLPVILFLCLSLTASSQTKSLKQSPQLANASPGSVGMSEERLQRIDAMCNAAIMAGSIPGVVALVARNGKIVYHKAFGMADNGSNRKLKPDDVFRIASQSKAITATAVMMLWEEGKFRLDDPISKHIPEFKNPRVLKAFQYRDTTHTTEPASKEITVRHLLTHTSGIGYGVIDGDERFQMIFHKAGITDLFTTEDIAIEENIKKLAKLPLHHDPGEKYVYSEGLDVLGYFIEVMSGMPFNDFLRRRLFDPLGMDDTWFYQPDKNADRLVPVQMHHKGQWTRLPVTFYDPDYPAKGAKRFYSGGAGLSSTAKDYATFLQMYLNGGELNGIRILSRTTIQSMMGNQVGDLWEGSGRHYGLAFGVLTEDGQDMGGRSSTGTFDWGGYFNTQYFADPAEGTIGVLMKQTRPYLSTSPEGRGDQNLPAKTSLVDDSGWKFRLLVGQSVDD